MSDGCRPFEEAIPVEGRVPGEQPFEVFGQLGLLSPDAHQPPFALAVGQIQGLVEERAQCQPALTTEGRHYCPIGATSPIAR